LLFPPFFWSFLTTGSPDYLFYLAGRLNQSGGALHKSFQELASDEADAQKRSIYDLWSRRIQELPREPEFGGLSFFTRV
jgi:hypothetical protein